MMRLTQAQSSTGQLSASITLPSHCRHRPTAKLKAEVADRVLHPAEHAHGSHAIERGATPRSSRRLDTATSQRQADICMHVQTTRAGCALIPECFFDEDELD